MHPIGCYRDMKMDFCAVCGLKSDLQEHHIEPIVFSDIKRHSKRYEPKKPLCECAFEEIFAWLFDQGVVSEGGTITVCAYHHHIIHGIIKFKGYHNNFLIREGKQKKNTPVKIPSVIPLKYEQKIPLVLYDRYELSMSIRELAKKHNIPKTVVGRFLQKVPPSTSSSSVASSATALA